MIDRLEAVRKQYVGAWIRYSMLMDIAEMTIMDAVRTRAWDKAEDARREMGRLRGQWSTLFGGFLRQISV